MDHSITELRTLILKAAPDQSVAQSVLNCGVDEPLDEVMPFSSVIVLGVIIALEDNYKIKVSRASLKRISEGGVTLGKIATMISEMESEAR